MANKISENSSFEEIEKAFKTFHHEFNEFSETFNRQLHILEKSNLENDKECVSELLKIIFERMDPIRKNCIYIENNMDLENVINLLPWINVLIDVHQELISDVNKIKKNLPVLQTIKLYLNNAVALLGKLCTAVANFLTITMPQKSKAAKEVLVTGFEKLKAFEKESKTKLDDDFGLQSESNKPSTLPKN